MDFGGFCLIILFLYELFISNQLQYYAMYCIRQSSILCMRLIVTFMWGYSVLFPSAIRATKARPCTTVYYSVAARSRNYTTLLVSPDIKHVKLKKKTKIIYG